MTRIIVLTIACWSFIHFSQVAVAQQSRAAVARAAWPSGTIDDQFMQLNDMSRTQEGLKMIRREHMTLLQKNINDSISSLQQQIAQSSESIRNLEQQVRSLEKAVEDLQVALNVAKIEQTEVSFLGMSVNKKLYHTILWLSLGILFLLVIIMVQRGMAQSRTAKNAKTALDDIQSDYDKHRKKALEREQKLKRQLQDEINKGHG